MKKPISSTTHGIIDYMTVAAVATVPDLFRFPPRAKWLCRSLAADYLAASLLTDYRPAVKRIIPFKVHGIMEGAIGAALPALPWVLGFARHKPARNFLLGLTAFTGIVAMLTDWNSRPPVRKHTKALASETGGWSYSDARDSDTSEQPSSRRARWTSVA